MNDHQAWLITALDHTDLDEATSPIRPDRHRHVLTHQERAHRVSERVLHFLVPDSMTPRTVDHCRLLT